MTRIAIVVGGASGMGAACAEALRQDGLTVAIADVVLGSHEAEPHAYSVDMSKEADVVRLFDGVEKGIGPVAVLVVAAGIAGYVEGTLPTVQDTSLDNWEQVMAVNARGPFLCTRELLRRRKGQAVTDGRVILISSMIAHNVTPRDYGPPSYIASKGAVLAFTKIAALEAYRQGITVNTVAPGAIDTPMVRGFMPDDDDQKRFFAGTAAGRLGTSEEIAATVAFLASPGASYINGACIDVNGGMLMR